MKQMFRTASCDIISIRSGEKVITASNVALPGELISCIMHYVMHGKAKIIGMCQCLADFLAESFLWMYGGAAIKQNKMFVPAFILFNFLMFGWHKMSTLCMFSSTEH